MNSMYAKHKIFLNCLRANLKPHVKKSSCPSHDNNMLNVSFTFSRFHFFICSLKLLNEVISP